jgi:hypothetical protein
VVAVIAMEPAFADGLTRLVLIAIPPLAAGALGWAAHGARPARALLAAPLLVVAVANRRRRRGDRRARSLEA